VPRVGVCERGRLADAAGAHHRASSPGGAADTFAREITAYVASEIEKWGPIAKKGQ
jgi:hypothetical protein